MLVRARIKGDIEKVFPEAKTFEDIKSDYKYRSYINRKEVAYAISEELIKINYDNFKSSVSKDDSLRSQAYMDVRRVLNTIQS